MQNGKTKGSILYWDGVSEWVSTEKTGLYWDVDNNKLNVDGDLVLDDLTVNGSLTISNTSATSGYAKIANSEGSFVAATVPAITTATGYELDIKIDGTLKKLKNISLADTNDWDAIAAAIQVSLRTATSSTETVVILDGKFLVNSITSGASSAVLIAAGTDGTADGDLLAAIDLISGYTTVLETPCAGTDSSGGDLSVAGDLVVSGTITASGLPTTDPSNVGEVYVSTATLMISV